MSQKRWDFHECVEEMIASCEKIISVADGIEKESLLRDRLTYDAVLWNIHRLGWAVYSLPKAVYDLYPEIEWNQVVAVGFAIEKSHFLWRVDDKLVWSIIQDTVPKLLSSVQKMRDGLSLKEKEHFIALEKSGV